MLLLFQAAAQQLPPINVTVQPPAGGMPEWAKILISAGTGALLGILSSIAMEYVKPWIGKKQLRKTIEAQLGEELMGNLNQIEGALGLLKSVDLKNERDSDSALDLAGIIIKDVNRDRYDFYMTTQKPIVYEVDAGKSLSLFYSAIKELPSRVPARRPEAFIRTATLASKLGQKYIESHGLNYTARPVALQDVYASVRAERKAEGNLPPDVEDPDDPQEH